MFSSGKLKMMCRKTHKYEQTKTEKCYEFSGLTPRNTKYDMNLVVLHLETV